ncbi:hypothetical protein ACBY01_14585 [Sphingomonas sp. ac-8]|uniref:hypothetical protein n=1 Tax=Sphingomonas sp. ac-8 TaxID=3242977 RepID=UPI003A80F3E2
MPRSKTTKARTLHTIRATRARLTKQRDRARTGQFVRRDSYHQGEREMRRWGECNTFSRGENNARMRAAEAFDHETKRPGARNGDLGHVALEVLRFMLRLRAHKTGRLDPSYGWMAQQLRRSRSTVIKAIARLKRHGFLDWIRRTRPVPNPRPGGQYVEQISNAYFLSMPAKAAAAVGRMTRAAAEATQRAVTAIERDKRQERADATAARRGSSANAGIEEAVETPSLAQALSGLRSSVWRASPPSGRNGAL